MPVSVTLDNLTKQIGSVTAVDGLSLDLPRGHLLFILGPSGCGKTTTLRMIAGLSDPTSGRIEFDGRDVTHVSARKRNVGMVFQSYALWPHMTVAENVEFGLRSQKVPRIERRFRVSEVLEMVGLSAESQRKPGQLSGGQQQRVALARALAVRPDVLLLDEPLSNLDANLRLQLRDLIRDLCKSTGVTAVYVTHDQEEAMSIADEVAILRAGRLEQVGAPDEVYARPDSAFVAQFLGEANILAGDVVETNGTHVVVRTPGGAFRTSNYTVRPRKGQRVLCSIRPEIAGIREAVNGENLVRGMVKRTSRKGHWARHTVAIGEGTEFVVLEPIGLRSHREGEVPIAFDPSDVAVLSRSDGVR